MNKTKTYYQPIAYYDDGTNIEWGDIPEELFSFQAFASIDDCKEWLENNGYDSGNFNIREYHDDDIEGVTILDADGEILETNEDDIAKPEHRVKIGEKVFEFCNEFVCEVVKFLGNGLVLVNKGKFSEHNRNNFDLDEAEDNDEWIACEDDLYQFADGLIDVREGMPVCIEHNKTEYDYPYYSPYLQENLYDFEVMTDFKGKALDKLPKCGEVPVENKREFFDVLRVSRADFEAVGYDASGMTDDEMEQMARRMGDTLMSGGDFWLFLECWGEDNGLPKIEMPE